MHPQVSIIIPFIDEYDYLREAIASANQQALASSEIIVVGNQALPPDQRRLDTPAGQIIFLHEPVPGSAYARNAGLAAAKGDWIQFLDVDDLLLPGKIVHQREAGDADVIASPHLFQFLDGKKEKSKWLPADVWAGLLNSGLGSTSSMLWKRESLLAAGGWNTAYHSHQEYELLFRILQSGGTILPVDGAETLVRQRPSGSITLQSKSIRPLEGLRLREAMWHYLVREGMMTSEREKAFLQYIFRQLRGLYRTNPGLAVEKYHRYFDDKNFIPDEIPIPGYTLLLRVFGFERTERLIKTFLSWKQ